MKLLYIIDTLQSGGTEKSLLELTTHLEKAEPVVYYVYEGDSLRAMYQTKGVRVIPGGAKAKYGFVRAIRNTLKLIRDEKPDVIHTSLARANFIGRVSGRITQTPVISSFVNDSYSQARFLRVSHAFRKKLKVIQLLDRWTSRFVIHFVANSQATKDSNCDALGIKRDRVTVIYRGRDPAPFLNPRGDLKELRESLGIGFDLPMILNVGRLHSQKGQMDLLRAMSLVVQKMDAHLLIAGEGPLRNELTREIENLGLQKRVTLLGVRRDIPELLNLTDFFAFPSYYEGHPGSVVEAMFAARPIIASDIPVHRETIVHSESGYLVPAGVPESLAEGMVHLLRNHEESKRLGLKARETALEKFHIKTIVRLHEDLYQKIIESSVSTRKPLSGSVK